MRLSTILVSACYFCLNLISAWAQNPAIQKLALVGSERGVGVQIVSTEAVPAEAQVLSGPDRIVIDFPGAVPGPTLRSLRLNQGIVRSLRVGLFHANPPVTRVVLDLNGPTPYRLVSSGKAVTIKLGSDANAVATKQTQAAKIVAVSSPAPFAQTPPNQRVSFRNGLLTINVSKATLAEVLYEVHLRTGAEIPIPSGAEQESIAIQVGPGRPKDVLAALLNGSRFNFILQGSPNDPDGIGTVLLTPRSSAPDSPSQAYTPPPAPVMPPQTPPADQNQQAVVPDGSTDQDHPIGPPVMTDEDDPEGPPPPSAVQPDGQLAPPTAPPNPPMQPDPNTPPNPDNQQ
jgi:hypothetical protein